MQQKIKRYFSFNDALLVGALLVALALVWNTVSAMQRNYHLQQKYDKLNAEVELLKIKNQNLKYTINYRKTNDYLELAARDKLNKATSGETLVFLPGDNKTAALVAKNTVKSQAPVPTGLKANLTAWWNFLQGKHHI